MNISYTSSESSESIESIPQYVLPENLLTLLCQKPMNPPPFSLEMKEAKKLKSLEELITDQLLLNDNDL